jgi:hypothetical protein
MDARLCFAPGVHLGLCVVLLFLFFNDLFSKEAHLQQGLQFAFSHEHPRQLRRH